MKNKKLNKPQTRGAEFRAESINEESRTAEFVISTEAVDTYDTVFMASGWDLARYQKNPVVTFQHRDNDPDPNMVIGTSEVFVDDENRLIGRVTFEGAEDNEVAEKVFRKVKNGILRGASIRASVHEGRWGEEKAGENPEVLYFTRSELMAWSIVTVQSNPDALSRNFEAVEDFKKELIPVVDAEEIRADVPGNKGMSSFDAQLLINQNL